MCANKFGFILSDRANSVIFLLFITAEKSLYIYITRIPIFLYISAFFIWVFKCFALDCPHSYCCCFTQLLCCNAESRLVPYCCCHNPRIYINRFFQVSTWLSFVCHLNSSARPLFAPHTHTVILSINCLTLESCSIANGCTHSNLFLWKVLHVLYVFECRENLSALAYETN